MQEKKHYDEYIRFQDVFPLTSALTNIFKKNNNNNSKSFSSYQLKKLIETQYNYQSDEPKYILLYIIDKIHNEIKNPVDQKYNQNQFYSLKRKECYDYFLEKIFKPENTSVISNNFFGIKEKNTNCPYCKNTNFEYNIFTLLEFSIKETIEKMTENIKNCINCEHNKTYLEIMKKIEEQKISLKDCFNYYIYFYQKSINFVCKYCRFTSNNNEVHLCYYRLISLPNLFAICIEQGYQNSEPSLKVEFSETLDISDFLEGFVEKKIYDLIGIILYKKNNDKKTYFACTKNRKENQWYKIINDSFSKINISDAITLGFPYILFYQKK